MPHPLPLAPTARKAINLFVSLGILHETTGKARDRAYVYRQYFDLLAQS